MNITYSKCFIIGMVLSLSLQAKGITCCQCLVPWGAIKEQQEEQERQRRKEQLNKLLNELIKQGKPIEITTDKDVKLLIKQRKMVDEYKNQGISLPEAIAWVVFAGFLAFFPIFIERFFFDKL